MSRSGGKTAKAQAIAAERMAKQRAAERRRRSMMAAITALGVLIAVSIIGIAVYKTQTKDDNVIIPKNASATGITVGNTDAKVTVDVYLDFMCPHCKSYEDAVKTTVDKYVADGTAKFAYHPVAYLDRFSSTKYSTRASAASGCAAEAGVFDQYRNQLFANQPAENSDGLTNDELVAQGRQVGATSSDFEKCVKDQRFKGWVNSLTDAASKKGVQGTPTVYVNDAEVTNRTAEALASAIDKAAGQ